MPRFLTRKISQEKDRVFVEVHQNGELLSKTSRYFRQRGSLSLTANPNGELTAPFYPLPSDIELLKITDRGIELDLDPKWEGFTTCDGKIENVSSDRRTAYTHIMKRGDFGSIAYNDLRILIRIGREHKPNQPIPRLNREYRGSMLEFWWGRDFVGLGAGLAAGFVLMAGFIYGLKIRPDDRPRTFVELRDEYTLPFISPLHFSQGPESLQSEYNRREPIASAVAFTKDFVSISLDTDAEPKAYASPILNSAAQTYQARWSINAAKAREARSKQEIVESKQMADQRNGMILIPVVQGEPLASELLRIQGSMRRWYESTAAVLDLRGKTTADFSQDPDYDFKEYKKVKKETGKDHVPFKFTHDEEMMYRQASKIASLADQESKGIRKLRSFYRPLKADGSRPLTLAPGSDYTPRISGRQFNEINRKIDGIIASLFDPAKPKKIREPVIGSLDPRLIQQTVDRSRFELQLCYELALRRNQGANGLMEWRWHLDTKGRISNLELVESSIADDKMIHCIREKLSRWNWPKPSKGSIQISFPFYFKPSKG